MVVNFEALNTTRFSIKVTNNLGVFDYKHFTTNNVPVNRPPYFTGDIPRELEFEVNSNTDQVKSFNSPITTDPEGGSVRMFFDLNSTDDSVMIFKLSGGAFGIEVFPNATDRVVSLNITLVDE